VHVARGKRADGGLPERRSADVSPQRLPWPPLRLWRPHRHPHSPTTAGRRASVLAVSGKAANRPCALIRRRLAPAAPVSPDCRLRRRLNAARTSSSPAGYGGGAIAAAVACICCAVSQEGHWERLVKPRAAERRGFTPYCLAGHERSLRAPDTGRTVQLLHSIHLCSV
jgi:hypothetical protein